jgi:hypothetical protein
MGGEEETGRSHLEQPRPLTSESGGPACGARLVVPGSRADRPGSRTGQPGAPARPVAVRSKSLRPGRPSAHGTS